ATGDMFAEGGVRTLWSEPGEEAGRKVSTAVSAERLRYLAEPGRAEYEGGVEVRQLDRELDATRLVVELDEARRVRRMVAAGGVTIVDRKSGRKVEGETAEHDLVARTILVEGSPVVLSESDGSKLRGPRLLYDVATGSARMIGSGESQ
ncbi:MAG TPA: LptA/OstA family protein, partial [Thermoanaerobaculia bacterium]|nr:LptA/OstA family protein [Thermoanaerobaculia bacterium]